MQENLTSQERLERIAEIINKGIYLLALKEGWFDNSDENKKEILPKKESIIEEEIFRILDEDQIEILKLVRNQGSIRVVECAKLIGKSSRWIRYKIKDMELKNILHRIGKSKNDPHAYFALNSNLLHSKA